MTQPWGPSSIGPAWDGHLALDAIVAYVDEELSPSARRRALHHLSRCPECASEVISQTQARLALRASPAPSLPSSLLNSLRAIPTEVELPAPPAGLAVTSDGQLVSVLRDPSEPKRRPWERRVRLGAGAVVTGLALGGLMVAGGAGGITGGASTPGAGSASLVGTSSLDGSAPAVAATGEGGASSPAVAGMGHSGMGPAVMGQRDNAPGSVPLVQPTYNGSMRTDPAQGSNGLPSVPAPEARPSPPNAAPVGEDIGPPTIRRAHR
jgi:anti-sigma factor RsiW